MKNLCIFILVMVFLFTFTQPVQADIAPPEQPPGANLEPGSEITQVRMMAETVLIEVQKNTPANSLGQAKVSAEFFMQNQGTISETMAVRFPISASDGWFSYPEIVGFTAKVDGRTVTIRKVASEENDSLKWVEFDVNFKPGAQVKIEVSYMLEGTGEYPFISFAYLLGTGSGWQGTIGSVEAVVRLPYDVNIQNVFIDSGPGWGDTTTGAVIDGRDLRWEYADMEPGDWDNIQAAIVMPSAWQKVLTEQANVTRDPKDGEAWGRLGKIYKEISRLRRETRWDAGGPVLFELSKESYEKALSLLPDDALWHAGYAELVFDNSYWTELQQPQKPGLLLALQELSLAVELKPNDPFIIELLDEVRWALPEAVQVDDNGQATFSWLTATPTIFPTYTPYSTPTWPLPTASQTMTAIKTNISFTQTSPPSQTAQPPTIQPTMAAVQPSSTPSEKSVFQLCSGILILPMMVGLIAWRKRR